MLSSVKTSVAIKLTDKELIFKTYSVNHLDWELVYGAQNNTPNSSALAEQITKVKFST